MTMIFMGYHAPTIENNKMIVPPSCVTITLENGKDCFGEQYIATMKQRYARPNKKINGLISLDMFKGKHGIEEVFYSYDEMVDYINMLHDDGYSMKRLTKNGENEIADNAFRQHFSYCLRKTKFTLPK